MRILVFGNPLVEKDNLVLKILPKLEKEFPKIEFKHLDPNENLEAEIENNKLRILDVVEGIDKITIINDIDKLKIDKIYSMHDFDLGYNLKLLEKIGKLKEVEIIGVPMEMEEDEAFEEVKEILWKIL
jgi:Ni,Fe-hydrogenase maturation factor